MHCRRSVVAMLGGIAIVVIAGACPQSPSFVDSTRCNPAHIDQPPAPGGILCRGEVDANGVAYCEPVNCEGEFKQVSNDGSCGGSLPKSGRTGCTDNYGSVDHELKVYHAYCILVVSTYSCSCRLKQNTDPVTGLPQTEWKQDVCECRDI